LIILHHPLTVIFSSFHQRAVKLDIKERSFISQWFQELKSRFMKAIKSWGIILAIIGETRSSKY